MPQLCGATELGLFSPGRFVSTGRYARARRCRLKGTDVALKRAFISFDYDHDKGCKDLLVGQSKHPDSPFAIADQSIKEASTDWRDWARQRIRGCDVVIVLCGQHTASAAGVAAELAIARAEGKPHFLLGAYKDGGNQKPSNATTSDKLYNWTWDNLKALVGGSR